MNFTIALVFCRTTANLPQHSTRVYESTGKLLAEDLYHKHIQKTYTGIAVYKVLWWWVPSSSEGYAADCFRHSIRHCLWYSQRATNLPVFHSWSYLFFLETLLDSDCWLNPPFLVSDMYKFHTEFAIQECRSFDNQIFIHTWNITQKNSISASVTQHFHTHDTFNVD
jgi:hypothetical protein